MRTISYVILLTFAWIGSSFAFSWLGSFLFMHWVNTPPNIMLTAPISFLVGIPGEMVKLLIVYRVFCWIKNKSIYAPETYSGAFVVIGVIASAFMLIVIGGHGYFIFSKASGVSGVPLGISIAITGFLSIIPVVVSEFRNFYAALPEKQ
jgi:hypothetical protein